MCKTGRHKYQNLVQSSDNNETKSTRSSHRNADVSEALSNLLRYISTRLDQTGKFCPKVKLVRDEHMYMAMCLCTGANIPAPEDQ